MLRRTPTPRALAATAVVATASVLGLGSALTAGTTATTAASPTSQTALRPVAERAASTSRDATRPTLPATADPAVPSAASDPVGSVGSAQPEDGVTPAPDGGSVTAADQSAPDQTLPAGSSADDAGADQATALPPFKLRKARELRKIPPGPVPGDPFTFQIGTLNILGSQHRGNGTGRAAALAGAITGRGVDVVGLQEVQDDQLAVLQSRLSGYTVWPGQSLGNQGVRLQIAFRDSLFSLVDTGSITTTFDFQRRPIPWVLLEERATGAQFYVIDVHNSPRDQEGDRDAATGAEIALINSLRASGRAVFIVGDTNEHTEFACRVAGATGMVGSNGLDAGGGGCSTGSGPIKIDHVLGVGGVDFSGHVVDYGAPVRTATDHAFVHATVTVTPLVPATDD